MPSSGHIYNSVHIAQPLYIMLAIWWYFALCHSTATLALSSANLTHSATTFSDQSNMPSSCLHNSSLCASSLKLTCNNLTGQCQCPPEFPVRLSNEIPCLQHKQLGELCLHTLECHSISHSACIATFLYPLEISSIPSFKQWFFYNQIKGDDDINYLLNKIYGQCRCKQGYRAVSSHSCVPFSAYIPSTCHKSDDCVPALSYCDLNQTQCKCSSQYFYDPLSDQCRPVNNLHGQFCVSSTDCQMDNAQMECSNSKCVCASGYYHNQSTGCVHKHLCGPGQLWNTTSFSCQPVPLPTFSFYSLMIKIFPLLLIKLVLFNLLRYICYERHRRNLLNQTQIGHLPSRRYSNVEYDELYRQNGRSLLSLPDYETILGDPNCASVEERLPTYEEVVNSLPNETVAKATFKEPT